MRKRAGLAALIFGIAICCLSAEARDSNKQWILITSPHFSVYSNASEKEAKEVAGQFEEIRAVFQSDFPGIRVDSGMPLYILAVKDENTMKTLLPDYWGEKGRIHPTGLFWSGNQEMFSILRTDVTTQAESPYRSIYSEYGAFVLRLNFNSLPLWLRQGITEFYGGTMVESNRTVIGASQSNQVDYLRHNNLIPIEQLLTANSQSTLLNDQKSSFLFGAETWAIVHYLRLGQPGAKLLAAYLKAWSKTDDSVESAKIAFGDLNSFHQEIHKYVNQQSFTAEVLKPVAEISDSDLKSRPVTLGEAMTMEADFLLRRGQSSQAQDLLDQVKQLQPDLGAFHRVLGYQAYSKFNLDEAEPELQRAVAADPQDFLAYFLLALVKLKKSGYTNETTLQMTDYLQKSLQINPNYPPTYAFLSVAYLQKDDTKQKALEAALKANQLEPANVAYKVDAGNAYIALNRIADAKSVADILTKDAVSPQEKQTAQAFAIKVSNAQKSSK